MVVKCTLPVMRIVGVNGGKISCSRCLGPINSPRLGVFLGHRIGHTPRILYSVRLHVIRAPLPQFLNRSNRPEPKSISQLMTTPA